MRVEHIFVPLTTPTRTQPRREPLNRPPRILLLEPMIPASGKWGSLAAHRGYLPPLGVCSLYTWLKHLDYDVDFIDTQFGDISEDNLAQRLQARQYDLVGIPVFTNTADYCFSSATFVRKHLPDAVIAFGHVHATTMPALTLQQSPDTDVICVGEGEHTIVDLIEQTAAGTRDWSKVPGVAYRDSMGQVHTTEPRTFIADLDDLPLGLYGDLDLTRYVPHVTQYRVLPNYPFLTQRGCPYPCTFCEAAAVLGKKPRRYSPERVIEELKILKYEKGARGIYFQDSTLTTDRKYVVRLLDLMIKEDLNLLWSCTTRTDRVDPEILALMRASGCRQILYGIESGNQKSLDILKKKLKVETQTQAVHWTHEAGIAMSNSFIICLPEEDEQDVANTIRYARSLASETALFYLPVPYPGSELFKTCRETGGIREDYEWSDFLAIDFDNPVYVNPKIGKERMKYWYRRAFLSYYSSPRVIWRNLTSLKTKTDWIRVMRGGRAVASLLTHGAGNMASQWIKSCFEPRDVLKQKHKRLDEIAPDSKAPAVTPASVTSNRNASGPQPAEKASSVEYAESETTRP